MNDVLEKDVNILEAEFYSKPFYFSYSSLNTLLDAPSKFYKEYVLKDKDREIAKYLLEGVLIHYLVLDGLDFDSKFIVAPESLPSESSMEIIQAVFKEHTRRTDKVDLPLADYSDIILEKLKEKNLHQRLKEDEQRVKKIADVKGEAFFEFLKIKGTRTIIDSALLDKCSRRAEIVKSDECIRKLIGLDLQHDGHNIGIYNELEISAEANKYKFGFKGIVDNLVVDVVNKKVTINDFKTTGKSLVKFEESVEHWNYWLQCCMYIDLVKDFLKDVIDGSWEVSFNFIVFDRNNQLYAFPVSDKTLSHWYHKSYQVFDDANYHIVNKEFDLPQAFALGKIKL